jgi:hypothetical protein
MAERVAMARAEQEAALAREAAARAEADRIAREKEAAAQATKRAAAQAEKAAADAAARSAKEEREAITRASLRRVKIAWDYHYRSSDGCTKSDRVSYMNAEGRCVAGPFNYGNEFSEGFAVVESDGFAVNTHGQDQRAKMVWFIDTKGELRFGPYSNASDFNDGFATVYNDGVPSFIDRDGNKQFGEFARWTGWFTLGVAPVQREEKGKMWFMDTEGRNANLGEFEFAGSFSKVSKLAIVQKDGKFGAINRDGQTVIPFEYLNIESVADYSKATRHRDVMGHAIFEDKSGSAYYMATTGFKSFYKVDNCVDGERTFVLMSKDGAIVGKPDIVYERPRDDYCGPYRLLFRN